MGNPYKNPINPSNPPDNYKSEYQKKKEKKELKHQNLLETLTAITIECSNDHNVYAFLYQACEGGYKGVIEWFIEEATKFEKHYAKNNWEKDDWYEEIDKWIKKTLEELEYDNEETYTL